VLLVSHFEERVGDVETHLVSAGLLLILRERTERIIHFAFHCKVVESSVDAVVVVDGVDLDLLVVL
jgi:hypothetical protein